MHQDESHTSYRVWQRRFASSIIIVFRVVAFIRPRIFALWIESKTVVSSRTMFSIWKTVTMVSTLSVTIIFHAGTASRIIKIGFKTWAHLLLFCRLSQFQNLFVLLRLHYWLVCSLHQPQCKTPYSFIGVGDEFDISNF
jgi:hypothetical protein